MSTRLAITLMLTMFFTSLVVDAAVYRWVDENGKVHYSDRPQPNKNAKRIDLSKNVIDASQNIQQQNKSQEKPLTKGQEHQKEADKMASDKMICEDTRKKLAKINSGKRMAYKQADGSPSFWSDEDYARERKQLNKLIKEHCK